MVVSYNAALDMVGEQVILVAKRKDKVFNRRYCSAQIAWLPSPPPGEVVNPRSGRAKVVGEPPV